MLDQRPDIDVVYCDTCVTDENKQTVNYIRARHSGDILQPLLVKNIVVGSASAVMLRKECFESTGLFDPTFRVLEDWEMWLRLAIHFQFGFVPQALTTIRHQEISLFQSAGREGYRQALGTMYKKLKREPKVQEIMPKGSHFIPAVIHLNVGNYLLMKYDKAAGQARQEFLLAISLSPTLRSAYAGLFKSLIGTRLSHQAWRLKWKLIGLFRRSFNG
jgi:hypothetical protein